MTGSCSRSGMTEPGSRLRPTIPTILTASASGTCAIGCYSYTARRSRSRSDARTAVPSRGSRFRFSSRLRRADDRAASVRIEPTNTRFAVPVGAGQSSPRRSSVRLPVVHPGSTARHERVGTCHRLLYFARVVHDGLRSISNRSSRDRGRSGDQIEAADHATFDVVVTIRRYRASDQDHSVPGSQSVHGHVAADDEQTPSAWEHWHVTVHIHDRIVVRVAEAWKRASVVG